MLIMQIYDDDDDDYYYPEGGWGGGGVEIIRIKAVLSSAELAILDWNWAWQNYFSIGSVIWKVTLLTNIKFTIL